MLSFSPFSMCRYHFHVKYSDCLLLIHLSCSHKWAEDHAKFPTEKKHPSSSPSPLPASVTKSSLFSEDSDVHTSLSSLPRQLDLVVQLWADCSDWVHNAPTHRHGVAKESDTTQQLNNNNLSRKTKKDYWQGRRTLRNSWALMI